jgi:CHAD domain-containing protein
VTDPRAPEAIGAVLHGRLATLVAELHVRDGEIRDEMPDGVHQARVASRRLRSALATFRPVLLRDVTEPIRADLRWFSFGLGDARDAEVAHERLRRVAAEELGPEELEAVLFRIDRHLEEIDPPARRRVQATLAAERYHALLATLDRLVAHPPWSDKASKPAEKVLRRRLDKERGRVEVRVERAIELRDHPAAHDEAVHDVRKAVKRLRYAWEVAEPALGEEASTQLAAAKELTKLLGARQDTVLTRAVLPRLEAEAEAAGEPAEPWARLRRLETERADHIASETLDMLKSGTLNAGVAVREK